MLVLAALLALLPAGEIGIAIVNQLVSVLVPPARLPRLDYCRTACRPRIDHRRRPVAPRIAAAARTRSIISKTQFLANRDAEIRFALLGDFLDAADETLPDDAAIVDAATRAFAH